jgi:predicted MPP superfamily phosphohydrolase
MSRFPVRMTRRRFLVSAGAAVGLTGLYAWRIEPHWVQIVKRELPIANLSAQLIGKTVVQISDLHVGPVVDSDYLMTALKSVSALEPDLVLITGDFMSYDHADQENEVARVLQHLQPASIDCVAILGNHDYAWGWSRANVADSLTTRLTDMGIHVLRNESRSFGGLNIIGLDDFWGPNFEPQGVLSNINPQQANLVLCHNPDAVDQPVWSGYRGWILSGHTHGGQCKPPFLPPPILPVQNRRYTSGEFDLGDGRWLYINRGLGYLRRLRFNARPEITVYRLNAATPTT